MKHSLLFLLFVTFSFSIAVAAEEDASPVNRISSNFNFDGIISEGEWDNIIPVELAMHVPVFKGEMSERSIVKMAYDDSYIYLSGELFDSEPEKIQASTKERDGLTSATEWFGMIIDSYNDKQNGLGFFTTPTGSRYDVAVQNDATGREPLNGSWNNFWDTKVNRNEKGWFVEMRVPFSSLQYQIVDGKLTMGITIWRYIARKNEIQMSPAISPDLGDQAKWRPSQSKEYVFEGIKQKKPLYITPYVLGGYTKLNELNNSGTAYEADQNFVRNIGIDAKIGITNNFTLDLTVNTDFAQVEADDQQINLSRFSLFFPEKRLFFQERSGIFSFRIGSRNNLFYSRRIGIDDDGNSIPIIGGARLTGRKNDWDIGLISMQTSRTDSVPTSNYSIFRVKKRVLNENSDVGFLLTNKFDANGDYNTVYGFDGNLQILGDHLLSMKFAQALNKEVEHKLISADPSMFWLSIVRRSQKGFTYAGSISRLGEDFSSDIGFINQENYTRQGIRLQYNWFPGVDSKLFRHGPTIRGASFWRNGINKYNQAFYNAGYNLSWKNGASFDAGMRLQYDDITEAFDLADIATIPVGSYVYPSATARYESPSGSSVLVKGEVQSGKFFDGLKHTLKLSPVYNISSSLRVDLSYEFNRVNFESRNQQFDTHIARLRGLVMFSTKLSISSFIQYNSLDKLFLGNIRLRFNPKEGNDLFIVYNTDVNGDRAEFNPLLPVTNQGSVLVKYSYTFRL